MNTPTFGARLRAARELRGMTAAHLASLAGIHVTVINGYDAGQVKPGVDSLRALALMLDISADYLLGLSDSTARINEEGSPLAIDRRSGDTLGVNLTWSAAEELVVERFRLECTDGLPIARLRGKNLGCWCKPGAPCHADVLLDLANRPVCEPCP